MGRETILQQDLATSVPSGAFLYGIIDGQDARFTKDTLLSGISSGFQDALAIADTPSEDGLYIASESGTYNNAGSLVVDLTNKVTYIVVSDTQTTFTKVEIPLDRKDGYIYVSDYSIDTTGVSSSSQGIQDALDAATSDKNVVVFPSGADLLCKNITIPENTTIIAYGCKFTFGGSSPSGYSSNSDNSQQGIFHAYGTGVGTELSDIKIWGGEYVGERASSDWSTYAERDAIQCMYVDGLEIKHTIIHDWEQDGIELKSCKNVNIYENFIYDTVDAAIEFRGGENITIQNNRTLRTRNCVMYKNHDVLSAGTTVYDCDHVTVINNYGECFGNGLLFNWFNNGLIEDNYVKGIDVTGETGTSMVQIIVEPHPVTPEPSNMENVTLLNNTVDGVTGNTGIRVKNLNSTSTNIKVIGNSILTTATVGIDFLCSGELRQNNTGTSTIGLQIRAEGDVIVDSNICERIDFNNNSGAHDVWINKNIVSGLINLFSALPNYRVTQNVAERLATANGTDNVLITHNYFTTTTAIPIEVQGDYAKVKHNNLTITGNYIGVKIDGDYGLVEGNEFNISSSNQPAIQVFTGHSYCRVLNNHITATSSSMAVIYINASYCVVRDNTVNGGNQGIRVLGNDNYIDGNTIISVGFNGIQIQATSQDNVIGVNKFITTTTDIDDSGTGTVTVTTA